MLLFTKSANFPDARGKFGRAIAGARCFGEEAREVSKAGFGNLFAPGPLRFFVAVLRVRPM